MRRKLSMLGKSYILLSEMPSILYVNHKNLKAWNSKINRTFGFQVAPQLLIILAVALILLVQLLIYLALSSRTIFCQLPNMRFNYQCKAPQSYEKLPTIYVVTPTYSRHVQKAELTRLSHTIMLVPNLHWIIVEDSDWATSMLSNFVSRLKNEFNFHAITRLHKPTPEAYKLKPGEPSWKRPKGIWQRNRALQWFRDNSIDLDRDGVIYFADDDNTYDLGLFHEMRYTRKVSVWPVGLVGGLLVERPIVSTMNDAKIQSFNSMWERKRPFPIDMAGFAVSMHLFMSHPEVNFSAEQKIGYVESHFLEQLVDSWNELEPKANKCTKILVWHTRTQPPSLHEERKLTKASHTDIEW